MGFPAHTAEGAEVYIVRKHMVGDNEVFTDQDGREFVLDSNHKLALSEPSPAEVELTPETEPETEEPVDESGAANDGTNAIDGDGWPDGDDEPEAEAPAEPLTAAELEAAIEAAQGQGIESFESQEAQEAAEPTFDGSPAAETFQPETGEKLGDEDELADAS